MASGELFVVSCRHPVCEAHINRSAILQIEGYRGRLTMSRFTPLSQLLLKLAPAPVALVLLAAQATPAAACGSLLAPNGAIRLARAATLVDWHDGVEHYMTSFTYQGNVDNVGWIVPLPANPEKIEE